jgi:hypothetical protein
VLVELGGIKNCVWPGSLASVAPGGMDSVWPSHTRYIDLGSGMKQTLITERAGCEEISSTGSEQSRTSGDSSLSG